MHAVSLLSVAPVKGLGLAHPEQVTLRPTGVAGDRRFYLIDEHGRLFGGRRLGGLVRITAVFDDAADRLALTFPDGTRVEERVRAGDGVTTDFYGGRAVAGCVVEGPWSRSLSAYAGATVRLVRTEQPGDGWDVHPVTLLGDAAVDALAAHAGLDGGLDRRRFRMLVHFRGGRPHDEDAWAGQAVRLGSAVVRVAGPVPRCVVTTQDPATGRKDVDALRLIRRYRGGASVDFGVYADVEEPGVVRVGDPVTPVA
ncbi:MAG TPA: MOSC N-terminal beta barrel domain-containing protein [Egibacteraceae bacterium]|jgi:uncharacterized protein|nr:MOSC N-terminal beta barrel domain-containing protein [Egibacteraceae bacterium]